MFVSFRVLKFRASLRLPKESSWFQLKTLLCLNNPEKLFPDLDHSIFPKCDHILRIGNFFIHNFHSPASQLVAGVPDSVFRVPTRNLFTLLCE